MSSKKVIRSLQAEMVLQLKGKRQFFQPAHDQALAPTQRFGRLCEPQVGEALEQSSERDLAFQTCQWRAQTEVRALPKGQVFIRLAADVKTIRIAELGFIVIRRT